MEVTGWTSNSGINISQCSVRNFLSQYIKLASHRCVLIQYAFHFICPKHAVQKGNRTHLHFLLDLSQAPVWSQTPAVPIINIRYDPVRCLNHLNGVSAKQLPLIVNELAPEATVGPNDGATGFDPSMGLSQRHTVILHEVSQTQRGWAAHACCTVYQHRPPFSSYAVDLISHTVKVQGYWRVGHVRQRDLYILHVWPIEVWKLNGGIHHAGDTFGQQQAAVGRHIPSAEEQVGGDLGNATQQAAILWQQPWYCSGNHRATVGVVVVKKALAAGTHWGIRWVARWMANLFFQSKQNILELEVITVQRDQPDSSWNTQTDFS